MLPNITSIASDHAETARVISTQFFDVAPIEACFRVATYPLQAISWLAFEQAACRIVLELIGFLDIALHRAVMAPAALALDVQKICAGQVRAGGQAAPEAMAAQFRRIGQLYRRSARIQNGIDAARI